MKVIPVIICVLVLCIGFSLGFVVHETFFIKEVNESECSVNYIYISDSVGCKTKQVIEKRLYNEFTYVLEEFIKNKINSQDASLISVYYRDLVQGPTFGILEKETFAPASLLKVPLMISILSKAETDPNLLSQKASYETITLKLEQTIDVPTLEPKKPYAIEELLRRMIIHSDNISYWLLQDFLNKKFQSEFVLNDTLKELGLTNPRSVSENTVTVKGYSSLFRQLYNASYLSPKMSEYALELLTQSAYKKGLVAGVPTTIKVAHKFGEQGLPSGERQLHDCGIVFFPDNPYLLCIMTKGTSTEKQAQVIKEISRMVYGEVDSRKI